MPQHCPARLHRLKDTKSSWGPLVIRTILDVNSRNPEVPDKDQCPRNPSLHSPTGRGGLGKGTADWPAEVTCVSGLISLGAG